MENRFVWAHLKTYEDVLLRFFFTDCNEDLLPQGQKDAHVVVLITLRLLGIKEFDESQ